MNTQALAVLLQYLVFVYRTISFAHILDNTSWHVKLSSRQSCRACRIPVALVSFLESRQRSWITDIGFESGSHDPTASASPIAVLV